MDVVSGFKAVKGVIHTLVTHGLPSLTITNVAKLSSKGTLISNTSPGLHTSTAAFQINARFIYLSVSVLPSTELVSN